jgi:DNA-directed RNA polymerase subunit RPC12/RpoP
MGAMPPGSDAEREGQAMDTTVVLVILVPVCLIVGVVLVWWSRRPKGDDSFYHFRCPKCQRRLRYVARQVGHKGKCSNCSSEVLFPPIAQSVD